MTSTVRTSGLYSKYRGLRASVDFKFRDSFLSKHDFRSSMIWNKSLVRIANRRIFYKHWAEAGVQNIKDLVNEDLKVIT